jgi:hypothetical protein
MSQTRNGQPLLPRLLQLDPNPLRQRLRVVVGLIETRPIRRGMRVAKERLTIICISTTTLKNIGLSLWAVYLTQKKIKSPT